MVNAGNWVIVLRGFERIGEGENAARVVQEWRCEIINSGCCTELKIWFLPWRGDDSTRVVRDSASGRRVRYFT